MQITAHGMCLLLSKVSAIDLTPPSLPRWNWAFALRVSVLRASVAVVQKPENHRDKLGGVDCLRTEHQRGRAFPMILKNSGNPLSQIRRRSQLERDPVVAGCLTQWHPFLIVLVSRSLLVNSVSGTRMIVEDLLPMTFSLRTGSWRWLFRACLVALLLIASATSAFAQMRASIPTAEKQKESAKELEGIHQISRWDTVPKKQDGVKTLINMSRAKNQPSDDRYVVLTTLIPLAKDVGDFASWLEAVNVLVGSFEIDANKEKSRLLAEYLEASKSGATLKPAAVDEALALVKTAAQENRYPAANTLLNATDTAVRRPPAANALVKVVTEVRDTITVREKDWKAFQAASTKLGMNADDTSASFTVGRWHVLQQNDWKTALPFLAKGSQAKWKAAAELELTAPLDPLVQMSVGDEWWKIGQDESGTTKTALLIHAGEWYARALPNLPEGLKKQLVAKHLDEVAVLKGGVPKAPAAPINPAPIPPVTQAAPPAKPGEWIDLLEWSEGVDWAPRGIDWNANVEGKPTKAGITLKQREFNHFPLPAIVDGDYEMECEFTRTKGDSQIVVFFPVGNHNLQLFLGFPVNGNWSGLNFIDGKANIDGDHAYDVNGTLRPSLISSGKRHRIQIRVHHDGEKAKINVELDDVKDYLSWSGRYASLTNVCYNGWKETMVRHPWIGCWQSTVTFHGVKLRMLSGAIRRDVITDADREQDLKNGFVRLVGEKAIEPKVGFMKLLVNQLPLESLPGDIERGWPLITRDFKVCDDFYGAHAPSRLKCPIPTGAKSFSVVGHNEASRTAKYVVFIDGKQAYDSGVTDIVVIKLDIPAKASLLELVGDPAGDHVFDHTYWCYPRFHSVTQEKITDKMLDGKPGPLKFEIASHKVGAGSLTHNKPLIDVLKSVPLHFRDTQPCNDFLLAIAPSTVTYQVPDGMTRFTAIGYNVLSHSVKYEVWADAKRIYESPQAGIIPIDVKLPPNTKTIELRINDLGDNQNDRSMWCYPRLHRK